MYSPFPLLPFGCFAISKQDTSLGICPGESVASFPGAPSLWFHLVSTFWRSSKIAGLPMVHEQIYDKIHANWFVGILYILRKFLFVIGAASTPQGTWRFKLLFLKYHGSVCTGGRQEAEGWGSRQPFFRCLSCACHCLPSQGLLLEKPFSAMIFTVGPVTLARACDEPCSRIMPETVGNIIY